MEPKKPMVKRKWMEFLPPEISRLSDLAYNLWFASNENAKQLFQLIDENRWEETKHNPVRLLLDTSLDRWSQLLHDKTFMEKYSLVIRKFDAYMGAPTWFQQHYPSYEGKFAYFSA